MFNKINAEMPGAVARLICKSAQKIILIRWNLFFLSRIPMQQVKRCKSLLAIQRGHNAILNITIDKIECNGMISNCFI